MFATLVMAMTMGTAPSADWQLQITMTMGEKSNSQLSPPVSRERCEAMLADALANKAAMEKAGGVTIRAGCVRAGAT